MRILHTADWHLGKKLNFFSRLEEQTEALAEICKIAEEQKPDVIFIAGDIFDNANPSNEATILLYKTLKKLSRNAQVPVIAIAGNHDSPQRINVADVLARENGILLIGNPTDKVPLFSLENSFEIVKSDQGFIEIQLPQFTYPIRILHTAYANEMRLKEYFGEDKQASLQESINRKWADLAEKYCDEKGVNTLITHLFMAKRGAEIPEEPDGERPLNVGTADILYSDIIPENIQYAALGHLHSYQNVGVHQPAIYSSSPLCYSFSEAGQQKYVVLIDIEPGQDAEITKIPLKAGKSLHKPVFPNVEKAVEWLLQYPETLIELTIEVDEYLTAQDYKQIYQSHTGIVYLIPKVKKMISNENSRQQIDLSKNIDELFKEYFKSKNEGLAPNEEIMKLFHEILHTPDNE